MNDIAQVTGFENLEGFCNVVPMLLHLIDPASDLFFAILRIFSFLIRFGLPASCDVVLLALRELLSFAVLLCHLFVGHGRFMAEEPDLCESTWIICLGFHVPRNGDELVPQTGVMAGGSCKPFGYGDKAPCLLLLRDLEAIAFVSS